MLISASDLITDTIKFYKDNFEYITKYLLLIMAVNIVSSVLADFGASYSSAAIGVLFVVVGIVAAILNIWIIIALVKGISSKLNKEQEQEISQALKKSTSLILPVIGLFIVFSITVGIGTLLLIIPGIIFSVWFSFSYYELVLDGKGIIESFKDSKQLVSGRWWGVFGRLLAPSIVFGVLAVVVQVIVGLALSFNDLVGSVGSSIVSAFFLPLSFIPVIMLYFDLKRTNNQQDTKSQDASASKQEESASQEDIIQE